MKYKFLISILVLVYGFVVAQSHNQKQVLKNRFDESTIYHNEDGITLYNRLIVALHGDSLRHNALGFNMDGWVEDRYMSGGLLHKGFYKNGKLLLFKNFFENGKCERSFNSSNPLYAILEIYYHNGNLRKSLYYYNSKPRRIFEYYENGLAKSRIEYDKEHEHILNKKTWYKNGNIESEINLTENKAFHYNEKMYYESGKLREEGVLVYSKDKMDYIKSGSWLVYEVDGRPKHPVNHH